MSNPLTGAQVVAPGAESTVCRSWIGRYLPRLDPIFGKFPKLDSFDKVTRAGRPGSRRECTGNRLVSHGQNPPLTASLM